MRASGMLLPISSLPSKYGIGCLDQSAYDFVDTLVQCGQTYWQILPMGPTGYGDSPYQSFSTFAGNPYFLSLDEFVKKGYLTYQDIQDSGLKEVPSRRSKEGSYVDYEMQYNKRFPLLRKAFHQSSISEDSEFVKFIEDKADWLEDYALFMAIKDSKDGQSFLEWEDAIKRRDPQALKSYRDQYAQDVAFYKFLQYEFSVQWNQLKSYANDKGIQIVGDIPIYVALDSADTWSHPELFQFTDNLKPVAVAGCPPDAFSKTGQLWGNPLYDWSYHEKTEYEWWLKRISNCFTWYDMVRIDHFRGFDEYYAIPYGEPTAVHGKWEKGPGIELFDVMNRKLDYQNIIAEDLGFLTDTVRKLLKDTGFPGMKVLQFAFDSREDSDYMPHKYMSNCVVYTGTHDNQTTYSWWDEISEIDRDVAIRYMNLPCRTKNKNKLTWQMIVMAQRSVATLCIIPVQDYLCLSGKARINTPSTLGYNWQWRMASGAFSDKLCEKIKKTTKLYGRFQEINKVIEEEE